MTADAEDGNLPDSKIPWWDNDYDGVYSDDPEGGILMVLEQGFKNDG